MNYLNCRITIISFCFVLTACTVGPNYVRPSLQIPLKFKEARHYSVQKTPAPVISKDWKLADPQDQQPHGNWWLVFHDPMLNQLEDKLNQYNQTNLVAYNTALQAQAIVREAAAAFFPTLDGTFSEDRTKGSSSTTSQSTSITTTSTTSSSPHTTHSWTASASWEPDLWGAIRRNVEAKEATAKADAALFYSTQLLSQALLAQSYFSIRGLDRTQDILNKTLAADQKILQLTQHQYKSGIVSRADVLSAQSVVETVRAQAIQNGIARGQYEHAIAVLIGETPSEFTLDTKPTSAQIPEIPVTVPSVWLERRPDVAAAERQMQSANAEIGVAVAAYFPQMNLTGSVSKVGNGGGPIFSAPTLAWALGGQLAETLFDGGLRHATVDAAKAGYYSTVASYRLAVLTAFQDVEDNLLSLRRLNQESVAQKKAVSANRAALTLITNQYKAGIVNYSSVMTAQISTLTAEQAAVTTDSQRYVAAVALIKALGG